MTEDILVLFTDDNQALRDLTTELLEQVNSEITVLTEADPTTVPAKLSDDAIECVVSDLEMPTMDGIELCEQVRRDHPDLPFFLLTSKDEQAAIERALAAGVTDYILKDPGIEHYKLLANRISNAVQHYRDRNRLAELESKV